MTDILIAVAVVAGAGLVCGLILAIASKFMEVKTDERIVAVRNCLPGANCGACGFSGCDGYAKALIENPDTPTNLCVPGADAVSKKISDTLGVEFKDVVEMVAYVHCHGDVYATGKKFDYEGINSCAAANMLFSGNWDCPDGCLGFGDCAKVCPNGAISVVGGFAHVDTKKCSGCGLCAKTCPNHLITLFPDEKTVVVDCSNCEKGAQARQHCKNACIGCKKCEKTCAHGAITVINNLAHIDYDKCEGCFECASVCPVGCIKIADFRGIHKQNEDPENEAAEK